MTWTYDPSTLGTNVTAQIRLLIGDIKSTDQQLQDEEIAAAISIRGVGNVYGQAAEAARMIAAKYAREVDSVNETLRQMFSARMNRYLKLADDLDSRLGIDPTAAMPASGGISMSDKALDAGNADLPQPAFFRDLNTDPANDVLPRGSGAPSTFTTVP